MDIRVSEFAPIVIYVCILYFVFYTEKRSVKISQNIIIITMTSRFNYNRVSLFDHEKQRNASDSRTETRKIRFQQREKD